MKMNEEGMVGSEYWKEWIPFPEVGFYHSLKWHRGTADGSDILLASEGLHSPLLLLCFGRKLLAHRVTSRRMVGVETVPAELWATQPTGLFRVTRSRYLAQFEQESCGLVGRDDFIHMAFLGNDFVLDAVVATLPLVQLVNEAALAAHRCPQDPQLCG